MDGWKNTLKSKTVLAGIVTLVASVIGIFWKIDLTEDLQQAIVDQIALIITAVSGIVAIYGRITAKAKLGTPPETNSTTNATD